MKRSAIAAAAAVWAATALSGCPLPQPLAEYPKNEVVPPLIVTSSVTVNGVAPGGSVYGAPVGSATILVPAGCSTATPPVYTLGTDLYDTNVTEPVTARWFVDYVPDLNDPLRVKWVEEDVVPAVNQPNPSAPILTRSVSPWTFNAYAGWKSMVPGITDPSASGNVHVVDLVVSNDPGWPEDNGTPLPYRSPTKDATHQYETQVYRWVFLLVPQGTAGVTCPP